VIVTAVNVVLVVALTVWILRAKTWKRMTLETNIQSKAVSDDSALLSVGDKGKTVTRLAPMGSARFGDHVIEVKALEGMVDPDVRVRVVLIEDNKIYVETVEEEL
jgi:membrane-bound ClpP family serine protease